MANKTLRNFLHGRPKVVGIPTDSTPVYSLHPFFLKHPIPSQYADIKSRVKFYEALHEIDDNFLPDNQKRIRYDLLERFRRGSGLIKFDNGVDYHGHLQPINK